MSGPRHDLPKDQHKWCESHEWKMVESLREALLFTYGKTVAYMVSWDDSQKEGSPFFRSMYAKSGGIQFFTDNTGFAIVMDAGWGGTDVTPGDPATTNYYTLTPIG